MNIYLKGLNYFLIIVEINKYEANVLSFLYNTYLIKK